MTRRFWSKIYKASSFHFFTAGLLVIVISIVHSVMLIFQLITANDGVIESSGDWSGAEYVAAALVLIG